MTENKPTYDVKFSAPPIREINLNFGTGAAGSVLESIVAHSYIMSAQYRIDKNHKHRRTSKEHIQNYKKVTGGAIFRNVSSRLGQTILEVQCERKETAWVKQEGTYKKDIQ